MGYDFNFLVMRAVVMGALVEDSVIVTFKRSDL